VDGGGISMKLMICIADRRYGSKMVQYLSKKGYRVTKLASTGGFLKEGNDTLLIGVSNQDIKQLQEEMRKSVEHMEPPKKRNSQDKRYTSFLIDGQNFLPISKSLP
jgi:uncharacterized protein YaaQ